MDSPVSKLQVVAVIVFATLCVAIGESLLSAGMKMVGKEGQSGFRIVIAAVMNWRVILGTAMMACYFMLYALTLSWADITFVLPFTALSYLFVAVIARTFLHEPVSLTRWVGAVVIVLGVIIVGLGEKS